MADILRPILELSILLPGMLLAYLPMRRQLRPHPSRLIAAALLAASLCLVSGSLCYYFEIKALWALVASACLCGIFYLYTLNVSRWQSISVFLAVCAVFSCLGNVANAIHNICHPGNSDPWLSIEAALAYAFLCWLAVLISWHPAIHAARGLLENEAFARTWYVFWILPLLFIWLNLFMVPTHPELLQQGRMMQGYIAISLSLLVLLLLFYAMFYLLATNLNRNSRLQQENLFLAMQQAQYNNLRTAISETREARHDMRHHLNALQSLAGRREWDALTEYLSTAKAAIPDTALSLCENTAVDAVASHYAMLCQKNGIPLSVKLDLPEALPVPEIDLCLVLSNLLENALEASLRTGPARQRVSIQAYLHSSHILLLTVENAFDGAVKEKDGTFQSSKHPGSGVGIQSVRRIAERNGGHCQFSCHDGLFSANIMLRGIKPMEE